MKMRRTSAYFKSSEKEPLSRQISRFFKKNPHEEPKLLGILGGFSLDFKVLFLFNFLIIEVVFYVLTFWKIKL